MLLDGVHIGCSHNLIHLIPTGAHKPTQAAHFLVVLPLAVVLHNRGPGIDRVERQARLAPQLEQAATHQRVLHAVGTVQIPAVAGTARAPTGLVVGHVPAGAGVVGLLGFPGHDSALDIYFPRARTGAIHTMGRAHNFVVRPAVAVGVFPGAVFTVGHAVVVRKSLAGLVKVAQSIKKVAHELPLE